MKNTLIYHFSSKELPELIKVGGKALSLIKMTQENFPVPDGFVLTAQFFEPWFQKVEKSAEWKEFIDTSETGIKFHCDAVKKSCESLEFNASQKKSLDEAMEKFQKDALFAVRSSSPDEDLEGTSFAGGYETTLGVTKKTLEKAILHSFISLFDERIVKYKIEHKMSTDNPRIAVIVQEQIVSDVSGVAFSLNPLNNCYDEAVINANFGLGETVVSGRITPDTYIVEKVKKEIQEKKIANKSNALWLEKSGGTIEKENANPKAQALTDEQILELTDLVTKVEENYKKPMDIEWAISEDKLYLLQARPITGYFPLFPEMITKPGEEKYLYLDIIVLSQGINDSFSVLGQEIWGKMMEVAKRGTMPQGKDGVLLDIHGREYLHFSNYVRGLGVAAARRTIGSYDTPTRNIFDSIDLKKEYRPAVKTKKMIKMRNNTIKIIFSLVSSLVKGNSKPEKVSRSYQESTENFFHYLKDDLDTKKEFDILVEEGIAEFGKSLKAAYGIFAAMLAFSNLKKLFKNKDAKDLILALAMDLPNNPTSEMGHLMLKLASHEEIINTASKDEFIQKLQRKDYSEAILKDYDEYITKFGARGFKEIDIATPRTSEDPEKFFTQLKNLNITDNAVSTVKERKEKAYNELLAMARDMGKEKRFLKKSKTYNELWGYREHPKYLYVVLVGRLRGHALKIGEQFKAQGRLELVDQIFHLKSKEIACAQKNPDLPLLPSIEKNLAPRRAVEHIKDWPKIVDSRGKIFHYIRESEEGDLVGDAIAPGVIKGKAKVLNSPYEKPLKKGEILVTKASEPAWTPIFVNAAAVVLEIGGPTQHGAIIAREYGIPCVSGIFKAAEIIKDGDLLEVDGSNGIVRILDEESSDLGKK